MKDNKKVNNILVIITIAVFLITIIGATFAYFTSEKAVGSSINANVETAASMYSFTASSLDTIEMAIYFNEMSETNVDNTVLKNDTANIAVSLSSPTDHTLTTCTYDIIWVWDDGDVYESPDKDLPFTEGGKEYKYEFSTTVDGSNEIDLSDVSKKSGNKVKIQEGLSITSESTEAITKTHEIQANIYNLPVNQTKLFDKNFKAHVTIDNLSCNMKDIQVEPEEGTLAYHVINTVYNSETNKENIKNNATGLYYHNDTLTNGAKDNTYRYAGADVHNYVCFQEEGVNCSNPDDPNRVLYRIISVDSKTNQTKVIKATSLGNMVWNSTGQNTWEGSSLETYLNGTYLISLGDKASKIESTIWSVGGVNTSSFTPKAFMDIELNKSIKVRKKIGLMYASEYGFAALPENWTKTLNNYSYKDYDWMLTTTTDNYPWTISRDSDDVYYAFNVISDNGIVYGSKINNENAVFPSFNLSSDVKIINAGTDNVGSISNPMIIV